MATVSILMVSSEEQWLSLTDGYVADIKFDYIYKRWYYDLYKNEELVYAGIPLNKDAPNLKGISPVYLATVENMPIKTEYEPFSQLGGILTLVEVVE
ncbi:MAG: hypothetical protein II453_17410 [Alphaproteobacteria bacterium]|nr:hypothetical protein [Alphaproteobacteria bacterium]